LALPFVKKTTIIIEAMAPAVLASHSGGKRGGFVRDRHGNPIEQTTASKNS
jgi:hypothetical protein